MNKASGGSEQDETQAYENLAKLTKAIASPSTLALISKSCASAPRPKRVAHAAMSMIG
jgi:hypothetical protein